MKNNKDFTYFVLLRSPNGKMRSHYGFATYTTIDGETCEFHEGKVNPNTKLPEPTKFSWSRRHKVMNVSNNAMGKDKHGMPISRVEFLRNHPECDGSPNNRGRKAWFKEMDADKDVDIALEANKQRREAENRAAALSGEELSSVAALYNEISGSVKKQKFAVLQWAFHDPENFLNTVNSADFKIKGFIRRALAANVLEKQGTIIRWGTVTVGIDEDDAVRTLLLDETIAKSISKQLDDKTGVSSVEEQVKAEIAKTKKSSKKETD